MAVSSNLQIDEGSKQAVEAPNYSPVEEEFHTLLIRQAEQARAQREQSYVELDGMTYRKYWETNAKAGNAYIAPRVNPQDVRITTGTTLEKKETLISNILNYDFSASIEAYTPEDFEEVELGDVMADLIRKSRELEEPRYEFRRPEILNEFFTQGTVGVEETNMTYALPDKELTSFGGKLSDIKWVERIDKVYKACQTVPISGLNIYLGNIREQVFQNQPFVFIRRIITRSEAKAIYGDWERFENVPYDMVRLIEDGTDTIDYNNWTIQQFNDGLIEEVKYYCRWTNNFMICLNGVMMFPVKKKDGRLSTVPLSSLLGENIYPVAWSVAYPIANFAYGKSIPSKTKVDQQVFDEMLRNILLKTRRSFNPPVANNTGYTLPKDWFFAGSVHDGLNPEKISAIGDNSGVTSQEFSATEFIKGIIDAKTLSPLMEGQQPKGKQTARAMLEQKRQGQIKLGLIILAVVRLEYQLQYLRLLNIIKNWTEEVSDSVISVQTALGTDQKDDKKKKKYRNFTIDSSLDEGEAGKRVVEMVGSADELPHPDQIAAEQALRESMTGDKYKVNYLNVDALKKIKYRWFIKVEANEQAVSELTAAMFEETALKLLQLAPEKIDKDYVIRKIALNSKVNPDKLILKQNEQQPQQPQEGGEGAQGGQPGQPPQPTPPEDVTQGMAAKLQSKKVSKPSINTMAKG